MLKDEDRQDLINYRTEKQEATFGKSSLQIFLRSLIGT